MAVNGFQPVHRVAQSYLGSLWIALDKRRGEPGTPVLLRRLQLPEHAPPDAREGIARAGRDALTLRHPNILSVIEVLEEGDAIAIAHEHVEAEPLRSLQSWANLRGLSFPTGVSLKIASDLLEGVEALHAAPFSPPGIGPFGGLSPDSVLVARDGQTRLCDPLVASCASLLQELGGNTTKLAYAAPEQVHAVAALTPPADVFACGTLLWELLSGRRLLSGSRSAIERKLLEHNLPSLATNLRGDQQVSSKLSELVERALGADPEKRFPSARAMVEALEQSGHEVATLEQVAQFVSKLSGQRLDRRSAAVRSRSLPDLSTSLDWTNEVASSGKSSQRTRAAPSSQSFGERGPDSANVSSARGPALASAATVLFAGPPGSSAAPSVERVEPKAVASTDGESPRSAPVSAAAPSSRTAPSAVESAAPRPGGFSAAPTTGGPAPYSTSLGLGRRTVAGLGMPNHPALTATTPFSNLTPPPFVAPTARSGPPPLNVPSVVPAGTGAPPEPAQAVNRAAAKTQPRLSSRPPPLEQPTSSDESSSRPPSTAAPLERLVPLVAPTGRSTRSLAPEQNVQPPSSRSRDGWARALRLVPAGLPPLRTMAAALLASVALASAVAVAFLMRRPPTAPKLAEQIETAQHDDTHGLAVAATERPTLPAAPEAPLAAPSAVTPGSPVPTEPEAALAPSPSPAPPPAAPLGSDFDAKQLDDSQLVQLFALEERTDLPACKDRPRKTGAKAALANHRAAIAELKTARRELAQGKTEKAHTLLCSATAHDPANIAVVAELADLTLRLGDPGRAKEIVTRGLEHKPHDPGLLALQGDTLALLGDVASSRQLWLRLQPGTSDADRARKLASTSRVLGDRALRSSNYPAAATFYRRALVLSQGAYAPSLGLSAALRKLSQPRAALAWAERAARAFPKDAPIQVAFGDALYQNGRGDEARLAWQAARDAQPNNKLAARRLSKGKP